MKGNRNRLYRNERERYEAHYASTHWCEMNFARPEQEPAPYGPSIDTIMDRVYRANTPGDEFDPEFRLNFNHRPYAPLDFNK